jgi:hypothetical protein
VAAEEEVVVVEAAPGLGRLAFFVSSMVLLGGS